MGWPEDPTGARTEIFQRPWCGGERLNPAEEVAEFGGESPGDDPAEEVLGKNGCLVKGVLDSMKATPRMATGKPSRQAWFEGAATAFEREHRRKQKKRVAKKKYEYVYYNNIIISVWSKNIIISVFFFINPKPLKRLLFSDVPAGAFTTTKERRFSYVNIFFQNITYNQTNHKTFYLFNR